MKKRKWTSEEIASYRKKHGSSFYFNKEDSNFMVPKKYGFGLTLNWANPVSWVIIAILIGVIVWRLAVR